MTFVDSVKTCLAKYADFSGRATRSEYWWFYLAFILFYIAGLVLAGILSSISETLGMIGFGIVALGALGFILPSLAAGVRRLHDVDKSGWFLLLGLIPIVGLVLLYFFVIPGTPGDNRFGAPPAN
ncbi:MAG: DUF805 domain-containing protein [Methylotenera sp.]|jgi:uncharacterized membrane protein YhaH (DUF805 family)|nr:DUF805 domain-containing protein [Methylotenera sp.]HOY87263.1 DUF805 domain-containing protein [Methylotenera sp.]HPH08034.1 DUF805 domain-containing protein [Methylotenera sp.]HPM50075.1 DUF805 domain-containing protein [Methylotenera sp.]HPV31176.1 DUF805 domain-containing protein [Methylotenera sp.]